eukprot:jgi/Antlo1/1139/841
MVKGKQPAQSALDDFTNLLLSFNSSNKIQLNVINIISETMCSRADEIASLIMKTYEQNEELGTVIDQLSLRNSLYRQLFEKYAGQKVQGEKGDSGFVLERQDLYRGREKNGEAVESEMYKQSFTRTQGGNVNENDVLLSCGKQLRKRKNTRRRPGNIAESGTKKRSVRASGVKTDDAVDTQMLGRTVHVEEKRPLRESNMGDHEMCSNDTKFADRISVQICTNGTKMYNESLVYDEVGRKKVKTTASSLLDEIELLVTRGSEVRNAAQTINTQLLDETLFKTIQCKICGLRYSPDEKEILSLHLADHQRRIRASEAKAVVSRDYMCRKTEWLVNKLNLPSISADRKAITCNKPQTCKICRNKISLSWCDDSEQWILEDAVVIGGSQYCHRKCVE